MHRIFFNVGRVVFEPHKPINGVAPKVDELYAVVCAAYRQHTLVFGEDG
jgi:hypothetical protein